MSLFTSMRTAVSGMNAQASRLGTVSDNIANVNTTGYKDALTEFETLLGQQATSEYASGGVAAHVRNTVSAQGILQGTTSVTDLAINGAGFFIVNNDAGGSFLTRAGSFVPDANGNLVNTAGFKLMGYPLGSTQAAGPAGLGGTTMVNIGQLSLTATPSSAATFTANLPSTAAITSAANLPSANAATAEVTGKTSVVAYDNLGTPMTLDLYFNKTAADTWEVTAYDQAGAAPGGGFPYSASALSTTSLAFDPTNGALASGSALSVAIPNGKTLSFDLSKTTQLAAKYTVIDTAIDGNAPSAVQSVEIGDDGVMYSIYANGTRTATYKIPLANVRSPDNLTQVSGNVYQESPDSGNVAVSEAMTGGLGKIASNSLEGSTVDLATQLTRMIEAQRGYTANSKVLQTSADLLDVMLQLR